MADFSTATAGHVFIFDSPQPAPELPDEEFPFLLLTGRGSSAQWHTGTRTDKSDVLRQLGPTELYIEVHPADARRLGIESGEEVRITSRQAEIVARAFVTPTVAVGQVFMPMHYEAVNQLLAKVFDPHSRQPSYKYCPVRLAPCGSGMCLKLLERAPAARERRESRGAGRQNGEGARLRDGSHVDRQRRLGLWRPIGLTDYPLS